MRVLGIETSCDETSVACVDSDGVHANLISSQVDLHQPFGGVVPELASRAHLTNTLLVLEAALDHAGWKRPDIQAVAATAGPGLIGAVLMGLSCAKSLAYGWGVPFVGVHHIEGHILANGIEAPMALPAVVLVVSGGHTETILMRGPGDYRQLGSTRDDAAGETFDKTAKLMGLPYPGGPQIERIAADGRAGAVELPVALRERGNLDFSFSGLKTAVRLKLESLGPSPSANQQADLARGLQDAIVAALSLKTQRAIDRCRTDAVQGLYLAGGVAANRALRAAIADIAHQNGLQHAPVPQSYCTDNAAMIAWAGRLKLLSVGPDPLSTPAFARARLTNWG